MSLFENEEYQWRETYFVFLDEAKWPSADKIENALRQLGKNYVLTNICADNTGKLESLTLTSPDDYAAMDVSCVSGEEVIEQVRQLASELMQTASNDERDQIKRMSRCTVRLDVYHFEQLVFAGGLSEDDEEEEFMDPGALLIVLEELAGLCDGIVVDPQAGALL